MKQNITSKQWNEVGDDSKDKFIFALRGDTDKGRFIGNGGCGECGSDFLPNIGEMIEFLTNKVKDKTWTWYFFYGPHAHTLGVCDILWEACKETLNQ